MSSRKGFLRVLEWVAVVLPACAGVTAASFHLGVTAEATALFAVGVLLVATFTVFCVGISLAGEFVEASRPALSWRNRMSGLSGTELKALTQWCPRWLIAVSLSGVFIGLALLIALGGHVHWSSGTPFTTRESLGGCAGVLVFALLPLPVLASASRMPGSFDNLSYMNNGV